MRPFEFPVEHHPHQRAFIERPRRLADQPSLPEPRDLPAQFLDITELVCHENNRHPLPRQLPQGLEQLLFLARTDAGRGFVEDQNADADREKAHDLQLLPFSDRQGIHPRFRIHREIEIAGQLSQLGAGAFAVREELARPSHHEIVDSLHRRKIERILVKHPDSVPNPIRGRPDHRGPAVKEKRAAVGAKITREDL